MTLESKWTDEKLLPYLWKDEDISAYIYELIEKLDYASACKNADILIEQGKNFVGEIIATEMFGLDAPFENDKLWVIYMKKASLGSKIIDIELCERLKYKNNCGLWVAGHVSKEDYIEHVRHIYGIDINKVDVKIGFLCKKKNQLFFSDENFDYMLPITTSNFDEINFDENIL